ncbi:MAG: hypothetical protein MI922_05605, partial [Bacteroidales bacterium]|nr:hypothetical protein [Bacteroidales bacterium]
MKKIILLIAIIGLAVQAWAQKSLTIVRVMDKPALESSIENSEWDSAGFVNDFTQLQPNKGAPSTVKTKISASFDDFNIYITFICYQDVGLTSNVQTRDNLYT